MSRRRYPINQSISNSKSRFSNRVGDYSKFRPSYPAELIDSLFAQAQLSSDSCVADVGSGTGLLTELLLERGVQVIAVEPNHDMRLESDRRLSRFSNYSSVAGCAEDTLLSDHSIDLITAAQAFHWFNIEETAQEFRRILKTTGKTALIWNRRDDKGSPFMREYDALLSARVPEYNQTNHANVTDEIINQFLGPKMSVSEFSNNQFFDLHGLKGRLLSSSYCPKKGEKNHDEVMLALEGLYRSFANDSGVSFDYRTQLYLA